LQPNGSKKRIGGFTLAGELDVSDASDAAVTVDSDPLLAGVRVVLGSVLEVIEKRRNRGVVALNPDRVLIADVLDVRPYPTAGFAVGIDHGFGAVEASVAPRLITAIFG
jgi:hypothetical protein